MSIEANRAVSLGEALYGELELKLREAAHQRIDGRWFDFDSQGRLILCDKPRDFLSCVWELLIRLFTEKYERIEREIRLITSEVNDYLENENNVEQLGAFVNTYGSLISALYQSASKMARVARVSRGVENHLLAKRQIMMRIAPFERVQHAGVPNPNYRYHGLLCVANEMPGTLARFRLLGEGLFGQRDLHRYELDFGTTFARDLKSTGEGVNLFADIRREFHQEVVPNAQIVLGQNGIISAIRPIEGQQGTSFLNESDQPLRITLMPAAERREFLLNPQEVRPYNVAQVQAGEGFPRVHFTTTFSTGLFPFKIGMRMGNYHIKINPQGNLEMRINQLRIDPENDLPENGAPAFAPRDWQLAPREAYEQDNVVAPEPYVLACLRAENNIEERVFIPPHTTFRRDYDTLRNAFGRNWNGRFRVETHYPKEI